MTNIPVRHINLAGESCGTFWSAPCIEIQFSFQIPAQSENGTWRLEGLQKAIALIDTGADLNVIDERMVPPGAQPTSQQMSHGVNASAPAAAYNITLYVAESRHMLTTNFLSMPPGPRQYNMILGRKFLQNVRFQYDGMIGISHLSFFDNDHAV